MVRDRPPYIAQGTWRSGAVHVWGWNGIDAASMAWFYGGFRAVGADGQRTGWHDSPVSYGAIGRLTIDVAELPTMHVSSVQLDPISAAVWLSELPSEEFLSDSLRWFARLSELARRVVSSGRITAVIVDEGPFTVARWVPLAGDGDESVVTDVLAALDRSMPPVAALGSSSDATQMFERFVDGIARGMLAQTGWRADLGKQRHPDLQALRATFGALAKPDVVIRGTTAEFFDAVTRLRSELDRYRRRAGGEPVVTPRIRLIVPSDPLESWLVRLEVVDDRDSSRWCSANDVWERNAAALEVARTEQHLPLLLDTIVDTVARVAFIPGLADFALEHEPTEVEFDLDTAEEFLDIGPAELQRLGIDLIGPERLVRTRVAVSGQATPTPSDDRRARFGREALVNWQVIVDDQPISDAELTRAAEAGATLLHTGHRWVRIDADDLRRKRERLTQLQLEHSRVTPVELLQLANDDGSDEERALITLGDQQAAEQGAEQCEADVDWVHTLLDGLPDDVFAETHESAGFVGELRHYQRRALSWMQFLASLGLGGCLADDMGLGKTATTLAHLIDRPGPHLVVCPLSVVRNWSSEAARFTPKLDVRIHHGPARSQAGALAGDDALFGPDPDRQLVITTYGLLPRDLEHLGSVEWSTVVLDEAQMVKNPNTKAARAVRQLRAAQKLALTGTPVENRLSELWAILDAVNPGLLGGLQRFRERFGAPIERNGDADAAARLRRLTQPFIMRRTKADRRLLPDLPDKIEQIAYARLTREQATMYQQVVDQLLVDAEKASGMRRRGLVLAALMRLKQICNHPAHALRDGSRLSGRSGKLTRFDELVTELLDQGERALVFTQFREMGELLVRHVGEQFKFAPPFLHGGVSRTGRDRMVDAFQAGTAPPLLVVSLKAGGTGLNLTAASQVIHYDRWWNPAVEDQATDRAWRIGQERTVNVHKLVCEGTVEERIGAIIDDKRRLADAVVGSSEAWLSELSTDELRDLVVLEHSDNPFGTTS
jgi:SNF2 family DNA or RNA helicase